MTEKSAFDLPGNRIVNHSQPIRIGKHEWRLTLYRNNSDRPLIGYEWRPADGSPIRRSSPAGDYFLHHTTWMRDEDWPRYDHNDGQYAGLPHTLRKLWETCAWAHTTKLSPS